MFLTDMSTVLSYKYIVVHAGDMLCRPTTLHLEAWLVKLSVVASPMGTYSRKYKFAATPGSSC